MAQISCQPVDGADGGCYRDAYAFEEVEEPPRSSSTTQQRQRQAQNDSRQPIAQLPPPPPPPASPPRTPLAPPPPLVYVHSRRLALLCAELAVNQDRSALVHALAQACGVLEGARVLEPLPATPDQLAAYHSCEYVAALYHHARCTPSQLATYGLQDDCAPFPGLWEYATLCVGGTLAAAAALCGDAGAAEPAPRIAVHLDGGRHHAHKSHAAGFCYVNDCVLAVLELLGKGFRRVMYCDVVSGRGGRGEGVGGQACHLSTHTQPPLACAPPTHLPPGHPPLRRGRGGVRADRSSANPFAAQARPRLFSGHGRAGGGRRWPRRGAGPAPGPG